MKTVAPAKINWTLEVLGRREDGYHEIRSVMQTIDLCDEVSVRRAPELRQAAEIPPKPTEGPLLMSLRVTPITVAWSGELDMWVPDEGVNPWAQLAFRAAQLLDPAKQRDAHIHLDKFIPVAAGLGGGSSDAAAALRVLDCLWGLEMERQQLEQVAAELGSDVAFFLCGGTALAEGHGERVTALPDAPRAWLVLLAPRIGMPEKTRRMYEALTSEHFNDGSRSKALLERLRQGKAVGEEDLYNAFERAAYDVFRGLGQYREALLSAGANSIHLAGAGPTLFSLAYSEEDARELAARVQAPEAKVLVARTLPAAEATAIVE